MNSIPAFIWEWAPSLVYCLACYALVRAIRRLVEGFRPDVQDKAWWNKGLLEAMPAIVGGAMAALVSAYPFPGFTHTSLSTRVLYGIFLGFFSAVVYKVLRATVKKKTGLDFGVTRPGSMVVLDPEILEKLKDIAVKEAKYKAEQEAKTKTETPPEDKN